MSRPPSIEAYVDPDFVEQFTALARRNERSASAEARVALKRHLENEASAAPAATETVAAGATVRGVA